MSYRPGKAARGEEGFTLVEVLVSFLILSLSLGVLYQSFATSSLGLSRVNEREQAAALAESLFARIGTDIPLSVGTREGDFDLRPFHWRVKISSSDLLEKQERTRRGLYPYDVEAEVMGGERSVVLAEFHTVRLGRE